MKRTIALLALLMALLPGVVMAQTAKKPAPKAQAVLEYSDDETQLVITDTKGNPLIPSDGLVLPVGTVIKTQKTTAEIRLNPNGSIIKLSASTTFKIEGLKEADGTGSNDFAILGGKIRTVAAKLAGTTAPGYNVRTPTANCGVRGTDFAMKYDAENKQDWVCVQEGKVEFTNINTGDTVPVTSGQFANTFDAVFKAAVVDPARLAELFSDLDFVKLSPVDVSGVPVEEVAKKAPEEPAPAPAATPEASAPKVAANDPVMEFLKKFFGLEVGSVTINGTTYSKAILSPVISVDSFRLGLYLPIVYNTDMFNPSDWYRPAGNNEWSFGSDKSGTMDIVADFAQDLALKVKYLEWGNQGSDPYYLKVGNLKTMTLGHGSVVRNFANDQDFPAIRKIGLNAGAKLGGFAIEGMTDDLASPAVVGGRLAMDIIGDQLVLGLQAVADLHLANASDLKSLGKVPADYGDPILLVGGLDLQFFKVDMGGVFRTRAFADVNTLAPYFRSATGVVDAGFSTKTIWDSGLGSLGGEAGFAGNILLVDYRLTFQTERGLYTNALFQGNYYRGRNDLLKNLTGYMAKSSTYTDVLNMGIYGSAGFDVGILNFQAAYRWPFELKKNGSIGPSEADFLLLGLGIPKDKIPFVKLSGAVMYTRTQFVPSLRDKINLFDAQSILKGEVVYGLAQGMDLVIGVSTSVLRNNDGSVIYDGAKPKVGPTVSLDTRVSF